MNEILICTMGLSPGVVTKMTQHLQEKEKIQLSEVCVVYTNNQLIQDLYNYVLREEFKRLGLEGRHRPKPLSSPDLESPEEILQFFEGLAELLKEKLTPANSKVHLCISGGRKSMAYAADRAVQKVAWELGEEVTVPRLTVWHVQLSRDEEPSQEDVLLLLDYYRTGSVSEGDRQQNLYPSNAKVFTVPYFHFGSLDHSETKLTMWISRNPSFADKMK